MSRNVSFTDNDLGTRLVSVCLRQSPSLESYPILRGGAARQGHARDKLFELETATFRDTADRDVDSQMTH